MEYEYRPPALIKPIFIEDNFVAPIFNEVMAEELRTAYEQMNTIDDSVLRDRILEFLDELINFNSRLLCQYAFDETRASDGRWFTDHPGNDSGFFRINPKILTCPLEFITTGEYLSDFENIQNNLYYLFSALSIYRYDRFEIMTDRKAIYYDLVIQLFKDLSDDNTHCYTVILKKYEI